MTGRLYTHADLTAPRTIACDVCVIGSGAGGAVLAAGLAERGLKVVVLEEGGYHTRDDFDGDEGKAFATLYQESGTRSTADLGITILQGRSVGGGTTINWTTCFRTPKRILDVWQARQGARFDESVLGPHWEAVEKRLNIQQWPAELVNPNNAVLRDGCQKLGYSWEMLHRNVNGCMNSGFCGLGCPVDGKQAMAITYLADGVKAGLEVYANVKAQRLEVENDRVVRVHAVVMEPDRDRVAGTAIIVEPKVCVSSGGAINGPALLLRSGLDDHGQVGKRTFLHPVTAVVAENPRLIEPWSGAPQSVSSHQFVDRGEKMGFFIEAGPTFPMLASTAFPAWGTSQREFLKKMAYVSNVLSLCVDGLVDGDQGGSVRLQGDGRIAIDYPWGPHLIEAMRESMKVAVKISLAGGSKRVYSLHTTPLAFETEADIAQLDAAPIGPTQHSAFTAHQMGGCTLGTDPKTSVVDPDLRHHRVKNLFVVDGSVLPTALGVNPSLTIYGIAHWARDVVASAV